MTTGLTKFERVKVRHHLGYVNVQEVYTFVLGTPAGLETQFIIEGAMDRVLEDALPEVRRHLEILNAIEGQKVGDLEVMVANRVGGIEINQGEQGQLDQQYDYWVESLSNIMGCPRNPFDKRKFKNGRSPLNARVQQ